ncbi:MAG TPA: ComF family protein [Sphingomonas sp.]|nr:ComF family protein [Sphingomonas sp.]
MGRAIGWCVRWALPPRCPGCGAVAEADHRFCGTCWGKLRFLGPPWCASCGEPFPFDRGEGARCGACLESPPRHDGARAAVAYGEIARRVALRFKYGGRAALAETVARPMARLLPGDADLLVPVPLHRWRLWSRGFNQAALIAAALTKASGIANDPSLLVRRRRTPPLRGMGPRARAKAVAGAFAVGPRGKAVLHGRRVVLIDDIHTSGATADACTRALYRAGAARVTVLCWARVLAGEAHD